MNTDDLKITDKDLQQIVQELKKYTENPYDLYVHWVFCDVCNRGYFIFIRGPVQNSCGHIKCVSTGLISINKNKLNFVKSRHGS